MKRKFEKEFGTIKKMMHDRSTQSEIRKKLGVPYNQLMRIIYHNRTTWKQLKHSIRG